MADANITPGFSVIFKRLSEGQLVGARIALSGAVTHNPGSPWWLARTVAITAIDNELKRRSLERGSLMGGNLSEVTPDDSN